MVLQLHGVGPSGDRARYNPVAREVIEARLRRYGGDNRQREATLKMTFAEAGCDDQQVSATAYVAFWDEVAGATAAADPR